MTLVRLITLMGVLISLVWPTAMRAGEPQLSVLVTCIDPRYHNDPAYAEPFKEFFAASYHLTYAGCSQGLLKRKPVCYESLWDQLEDIREMNSFDGVVNFVDHETCGAYLARQDDSAATHDKNLHELANKLKNDERLASSGIKTIRFWRHVKKGAGYDKELIDQIGPGPPTK